MSGKDLSKSDIIITLLAHTHSHQHTQALEVVVGNTRLVRNTRQVEVEAGTLLKWLLGHVLKGGIFQP